MKVQAAAVQPRALEQVHGYWSIDPQVLHATGHRATARFTAGLRNVLSRISESA
jgi:hypothetical protein